MKQSQRFCPPPTPEQTMAEDYSASEGETSEDLLRSITELYRRWTGAAIRGKGIRLADHELDLLNAVGLADILMSAAAVEQKRCAIERRSLRARAAPAPPAEAWVPDPGAVAALKNTRIAGDRRGDNLLRILEVRRRTGLSVATIYRRGNDKTFPSKVRLGPKSVAWYESEVDAFVADPTGYRAG